jgi:hypothetical protein
VCIVIIQNAPGTVRTQERLTPKKWCWLQCANPLRIFATQEAIQKTGSPGSATGIMMKSGTHILISAKQAPAPEQLQNLTVIQGRVVPPKTAMADLDEAAAGTLKGVTYVTFDVQVSPTTLFTGASQKKSD